MLRSITTAPSVSNKVRNVKTYIYCIGNIYELHAVLPSVKVMSVPLFRTMAQHPLKELGFEITLGSPHPQTVEHQR